MECVVHHHKGFFIFSNCMLPYENVKGGCQIQLCILIRCNHKEKCAIHFRVGQISQRGFKVFDLVAKASKFTFSNSYSSMIWTK